MGCQSASYRLWVPLGYHASFGYHFGYQTSQIAPDKAMFRPPNALKTRGLGAPLSVFQAAGRGFDSRRAHFRRGLRCRDLGLVDGWGWSQGPWLPLMGAKLGRHRPSQQAWLGPVVEPFWPGVGRRRAEPAGLPSSTCHRCLRCAVDIDRLGRISLAGRFLADDVVVFGRPGWPRRARDRRCREFQTPTLKSGATNS